MRALLLFLTLPILNCGDLSSYQPPIHYSEDLTPEQRANAELALPILMANAQPLTGEYVRDIERIEVSYMSLLGQWEPHDCWHFLCENFGVKAVHLYRIKVRKSPAFIPNRFRAWDNTFEFQVFGNAETYGPGIITSKRPEVSGFTEGFRHHPKLDWAFKPVPELSFLDEGLVPKDKRVIER